MNIALDYDGTYTADPELWDEFIAKAQERGHTVQICTLREPELGAPTKANLPVIFTSRKAKARHLPAAGTIWIDDTPETIFADNGQILCVGTVNA